MSETWDFQPQRGPQADTAMPRFHMQAVKNEFKSAQVGHDVFEEREYVEIIVPGQKNQVVDRAVRAEDRERWPRQYQAFKSNQEAPLEGWALTDWPGVNSAQVLELQSANIKTVEQLAGLPDNFLLKFTGGYRLREKARLAVEQAAGQEPIMRLHAENEALKDQMAAMQTQIDQLMKARSDA